MIAMTPSVSLRRRQVGGRKPNRGACTFCGRGYGDARMKTGVSPQKPIGDSVSKHVLSSVQLSSLALLLLCSKGGQSSLDSL